MAYDSQEANGVPPPPPPVILSKANPKEASLLSDCQNYQLSVASAGTGTSTMVRGMADVDSNYDFLYLNSWEVVHSYYLSDLLGKQAVVTDALCLPFSPQVLAFICIARRVRRAHCSSILIESTGAHTLALCARYW